jgi:hypothetical protein
MLLASRGWKRPRGLVGVTLVENKDCNASWITFLTSASDSGVKDDV